MSGTLAAGRRILVVDDDDMVRDFLVGHLLRALPSAHVLTANDGTSGLVSYRRELPDLIVTDLNMHQMSGDELIEHIRKTDTTTPILVLTGAPETTPIPGATEVVPKIRLGYLVQRVTDLLANSPHVEADVEETRAEAR